MKNTRIKRIVVGSLLLSLSWSAYANEGYDNEDYNKAYDMCDTIAAEYEHADNWEVVFDRCMAQNGFEIEIESEDNKYPSDNESNEGDW